MLKMQGLIQSKAFVMLIYMVVLTQFQFFCPSGTFSQSRSQIQNVIQAVNSVTTAFNRGVIGCALFGSDSSAALVC